MKNIPSKRWIILISPKGCLSAQRADYFRGFPDAHQCRWQRLMSLRLPAGIGFQTVKSQVYGWVIWMYGL